MDICTFSCTACRKRILSHSKILTCVLCHGSYHRQCIPRSINEYFQLLTKQNQWFCFDCNKCFFLCYHTDSETEFLETLHDIYSDNPLNFETINNMIFNPFSSNDDVKLSIFDTDPDMHFYSEISYTNMRSSNYFSSDQFIEKYSHIKSREKLSLLHWNIRSLHGHYLELQAFLSTLNFHFSFICISETWFTRDNFSLHPMNGYNYVNVYRDDRSGGGVAIYISEDVPYTERKEFYRCNGHIECLFIEVDKAVFSLSKNVIIGCVYRPPDTNVKDYNETFPAREGGGGEPSWPTLVEHCVSY